METKADYEIAREELHKLWAEHVRAKNMTVDIAGPIPRCEDGWSWMLYYVNIGGTTIEWRMGIGHAKMERFKGKEDGASLWKYRLTDELRSALRTINLGHRLKDKMLEARVACIVGRDVKPDVAEVVASACRDFFDANQAGDFESWCAEFGYDPDSRKAESTYRQCIETNGKLRRIGLTSAQVERFAELANQL